MSKILEMIEKRNQAWNAAKAFVESRQDKDGLLSEADARFEMVMMSLRLVRGLDRKLFQETFGIDVNEVYGSVIDRLVKKGWLIEEDQYLSCTKKSYEILNTVLEEFLPDD